jgi:hypothetical protein
MKYSVFQIEITEDLINRVNRGENPPEYTAYMEAMLGNWSRGMALNLYKKVSEITAQSLDEVFEIGNIGPEENIHRIGSMHSISVGDIIQDETGKRYVVDSFGFSEVV